MYIFFVVFFTVYFLANFYVFLRGWQALELVPKAKYVYTSLFIFFVVAYLIARFFSKSLPLSIYFVLLSSGGIWFFFLAYFFLFCIAIDVVRIFNSFLHFIPEKFFVTYPQTKFYLFLAVVGITLLVSFYGLYNRSNIKVKTLEISTDKPVGKDYRIVFFSDLHLTPINNHKFVSNLVSKVNALQPDLILIGGDLTDENVKNLRRWKLADNFKNFKAKFGVYSIFGNHEYINQADSIAKFFSEMGVRFLVDSSVIIDSSFVLIGRDEYSKSRFTGKVRRKLEEITKSINTDLPKILLDHTPNDLASARRNNVLLQLSGHTHNGQFFPLNLITRLVYEISWGYRKIGSTHYYVSSGVGSWGPPIKICSDAEVVLIILKI